MIHLEQPFRTTPELPRGHAPCSLCKKVLPRSAFLMRRLMCVPGYGAHNYVRLQKYRGRKRVRKPKAKQAELVRRTRHGSHLEAFSCLAAGAGLLPDGPALRTRQPAELGIQPGRDRAIGIFTTANQQNKTS